MLRHLFLAVAGLGLAGAITTAADPVPPTGYWKVPVPTGEGEEVLLMVAFNQQDGKWVGDYLAASQKLVADPKFTGLKVNGDHVRFTIEIKGTELVSFDGIVAKDNSKIVGSMSVLGGRLALAELLPTKLRKLDDPFDVARELLGQVEGGGQLFDAAATVLSKAAARKVPAEEVRAIVERLNKAAAGYGPRWEREVTLKTADALSAQDGYADLAVSQAKRAERMLTDEDGAATRLQVLDAVVRALNKAGKADEAKQYAAQIAKLEPRDYAEYTKALGFKPQPFAGRKGKSTRGVLVELFTGASCPPCAAADLAFDGALETYKPSDVVLLQYHIHAAGPDPLSCPDGLKRLEEYYADYFEGAPMAVVAGKPGVEVAGPISIAEKRYVALREQVDGALEKAAGAKLALAVSKAEKGGYTAKATVSDLEAPGEKMSLRFALAEDSIRYSGGNGIRYHHMVVRSMPGGTKGFALTKNTTEQSVSFDPEEVRKELTKYLDDFAKNEIPFARPDRPLALKNLKLVAFVQNDATKEVLTAVQVDVGGK